MATPKYHPVRPFDLDVVAEGINDWKGPLPIGASMKIMNSLNHLDQGSVAAAVDCLEHEHECGRWGRPAKVYEALGLDANETKALDKFHEAAQVDYVCNELEARVPASTPPPISSRDYVEAAFEFHSGE